MDALRGGNVIIGECKVTAAECRNNFLRLGNTRGGIGHERRQLQLPRRIGLHKMSIGYDSGDAGGLQALQREVCIRGVQKSPHRHEVAFIFSWLRVYFGRSGNRVHGVQLSMAIDCAKSLGCVIRIY